MKTQQNKLTKIGMILLMAVASVVNTQNAKGQSSNVISCSSGTTVGPNASTSNTNVGIGTTSPALKLQINTAGANDGIRVVQTGIGLNQTGAVLRLTSGHDWALFSSGSGNSEPSGNFGIFDYTNASASGGLGYGYRFMINALTGNVGIGLNGYGEQPLHKLHVHNGAMMISGSNPMGGPMLVFSDNISTHPNGKSGIEYDPSVGGLNFWKPSNAGSGAVNYNMFIKDNGNIGIGTGTPSAKLQVDGTTSNLMSLNSTNTESDILYTVPSGSWQVGTNASGNGSNSNQFFIYDNSNASYPFTVQKGTGKVGIGTNAPCEKLSVSGSVQIDATSQNNGTINNSIKFGACGTGEGIGSNRNPTTSVSATTSFGNNLEFFTNSIRRMMITNDGRVAIGTVVPNKMNTAYKLWVNGGIQTTALSIKNYTVWPDYVFNESYQLKSLDELEDYIKENNHLPGIPSAKEINDEGIEIGAMQTKQMEKIEELTLYLIEMKKEIQSLKEEKATMKSTLTNSKN